MDKFPKLDDSEVEHYRETHSSHRTEDCPLWRVSGVDLGYPGLLAGTMSGNWKILSRYFLSSVNRNSFTTINELREASDIQYTGV